MPTDPEDLAADERPSKTQRKREMLELQALGEELAELPEEHLRALSLPENLLDALLEYKRTPSHGGRRRQMQYVGKLMRGLDAEPARTAIEAVRRSKEADTRGLHEAEEWRARLIENEAALEEFLADYPQSDARRLRVLVRAARADAPQAVTRRALRELFRFVRAALLAAADR